MPGDWSQNVKCENGKMSMEATDVANKTLQWEPDCLLHIQEVHLQWKTYFMEQLMFRCGIGLLWTAL